MALAGWSVLQLHNQNRKMRRLPGTGRNGHSTCSYSSGCFYGESVKGFGDDDPGGEISEGADAGHHDEENGNDADEVEVPSVVLGETGTDSGDHAAFAGAGELSGVLKGGLTVPGLR